MELINMKKFFLLLFITLTWAGLSRASIGETIQQSLERAFRRSPRDGKQFYVACQIDGRFLRILTFNGCLRQPKVIT